MLKKMALLFLLLGSFAQVSIAGDDPKLWFNLGATQFYVPFTSVDAVYQWELKGKRSMVGGETPLGAWKRLQVTGGAVTSLDGRGSPFLGVHLAILNPVETWLPLQNLHPGLFAGYDFNRSDWMVGFKTSLNIFG